MATPETSTESAPAKKKTPAAPAKQRGRVILGTYKHKDTGAAHTVTRIEKDVEFGTGREHRVWFSAPHMLEPKAWPEQQFLDEMSDEDPIPSAEVKKEPAAPAAAGRE